MVKKFIEIYSWYLRSSQTFKWLQQEEHRGKEDYKIATSVERERESEKGKFKLF